MPADWSTAFAILRDNGVEVLASRDRDVILRTSLDHEIRCQIVDPRAPYGSSVRDSRRSRGVKRPLHIVRHATEAQRAAASDRRIALVITSDRSCIVDGRQLPRIRAVARPESYRLCALARILLSTKQPWRQSALPELSQAGSSSRPGLSTLLDVKQSRVSTLLREFPSDIVRSDRHGSVVTDPDALWEWHLNAYPGPWGLTVDVKSIERTRKERLEYGKAFMTLAADRLEAKTASHAEHAQPALVSGLEALPRRERERSTAMSTSDAEVAPVIVLGETLATIPPSGNYRGSVPWEADLRLAQITDRFLRTTAGVWGDPSRTDPAVTAWVLDNPRDQELLREYASDFRGGRSHPT